MEWMELVSQFAKSDAWYQACFARMKEKEEKYLEIMDLLTPQQRQAVEDYIAASEEMEHALLPIAYRLGAVVGDS
jgi:hypothetical protein